VDPGEVGQLVTSAASGDATAWQALAERFSGLVWSVTRAFRLGNADAADVFQTTWLRLAENIGGSSSPTGWAPGSRPRPGASACSACGWLAGRCPPMT
jgi:DNA-directed RNA polymerase specialized sigma24 family protein